MKKIALIVNKNWETEPILNAMTNPKIRPQALKFPTLINSPREDTQANCNPRAKWSLSISTKNYLEVSLWCIQDLMNPESNSSSSEEKHKVLPSIIKNYDPDLVIAVGTAGYPSDNSINGSVIIGSNFFIHDGHSGNSLSNLQDPDIGKLILSNINQDLFKIFNGEFKNSVESKFIKALRNPIEFPVCVASNVYTAISTINVTDYNEYNWVDQAAIEHYYNEIQDLKIKEKYPAKSSETTHGVIKLSTNKPIIFVSGITDRVGYFDTEVNDTQNYIASFNAGIVLGQMLVSIYDYIRTNNEFIKI
jgi:hypothetical protein